MRRDLTNLFLQWADAELTDRMTLDYADRGFLESFGERWAEENDREFTADMVGGEFSSAGLGRWSRRYERDAAAAVRAAWADGKLELPDEAESIVAGVLERAAALAYAM